MEGLCYSSCAIFTVVLFVGFSLLDLVFDCVFCLLGSLSVVVFGVGLVTLLLVGMIMGIFLEICPPEADRNVSRFSRSP
jgi:hypothetical protein